MLVYLGCEGGTCSDLMMASLVDISVDDGLVVLEGPGTEDDTVLGVDNFLLGR